MKNMEFNANRNEKAVTINETALKLAGFRMDEALSVRVMDGLILLSKVNLTAKDLVDMTNDLYTLAGDLVDELVGACGTCEECKENCEFYNAVDQGEPVQISEELRRAVGIPEDVALDVDIDETHGTITVRAADHRYDLRSVPSQIAHILGAAGICLGELDRHLRREDIVYGD